MDKLKKIIFDIDGTLTDFNGMVRDIAAPYFLKKYGIDAANPMALEIEDVFEIRQHYLDGGCSESEARQRELSALNRFWISNRFFKFFMTGKFRDGAKELIQRLQSKGYRVEIHTSRASTRQRTPQRLLVKVVTKIQFWTNGISTRNIPFHFYECDQDKIEAIIESKPKLVFDDKPEIVKKLVESGIPVLCMKGKHNAVLAEKYKPIVVDKFDLLELENKGYA